MSLATQPDAGGLHDADWRDRAYDLTRGIAAYAGSGLVAGLARVISRHPHADIATAFNHKQVACKMWARDKLLESFGGRFGKVWVLGGWYGVLAAMLFDDPRFDIGAIESFDIDPGAAAIARTLNGCMGGRFEALTADMYALDYVSEPPDLVINTSCEHIADLRGWLRRLPGAMPVLLQSNDYFSEPSHVSCMPSLAAFIAAAGLTELRFAGELPLRNYTRFMIAGRV